ncbi:queuosine precursor transporter [Dongshaea marina]|uniref:queuosine precursor transporter n=1 Tax=Dongshaea marina TaxID=2047966 RepID=UPI000D3E2E7B|nr:queuosine precursor transporter [Dongshaea marina]
MSFDTSAPESQITAFRPRYLWFLITSYAMIIVLSNWFDPRIIGLGHGLSTDAGTLIFPLAFLLSDLITEVYGYKFARMAVWTGFLFNWVFVIYGQIITHMPTPEFASQSNHIFDSLLTMNSKIIIASTISYIIAEPLNSYVMAKLKIRSKGKLMGARFVASTLVASFFDSNIFGFIAFYGVMPTQELIKFNLTMWVIKVIIEVIGMPFSVHFARKLKNLEKLDIYDDRTNFNLFKLNTEYGPQDNRYLKN